MNLPDDCDIMLDEDKDGDDHIDHPFHPCVDHYVKSCLKMNLSVKGKMHHLLTDHKELKETKLPDVNIQYLYLIDELCKLMESCDPRVFTDKCASLMASDIHNIPLFSDKVLNYFGQYHNVSIMLRYLMCYFTWCDFSAIQKLLEICGYSDGVGLLENYKLQIEYARPFTEYPIPSPHSLIIPSDASQYTVMATRYELKHTPLSLRHIEIIKSPITECCEITPIGCQFLAIKAVDYQIFHWLIPKSVTPLIVRKAQENCSYLHKHGIKDIYIFPSFESFFTYDKKFSLFSADPVVDKVDPDVDKADPNVDQVGPHVDQVDLHVDKADQHVDKVDAYVDKVDLIADKVDSGVDKDFERVSKDTIFTWLSIVAIISHVLKLDAATNQGQLLFEGGIYYTEAPSAATIP